MLIPQSLFDPCEAFGITITDPVQMDAVCESAERNAVFLFLDFPDKSVYIIAGSEIQFTGKLSVQCMFDGDVNDCGAAIYDGVKFVPKLLRSMAASDHSQVFIFLH